MKPTIDINKEKEFIDMMTQYQMAHLYRFAPVGHMYFSNDNPELFEYFNIRFKALGGMTTEISKQIGW